MRQFTSLLLALSLCPSLSAQQISSAEQFTTSIGGWHWESKKSPHTRNFIPDCTPPQSPRIESASKTSFTVQWDGIGAAPGVAYYVVRYRIATSKGVWKEKKVEKGNSLEVSDLPKEQPHEIEVQKVCFWEDGSLIYSEWVAAETAVAARITLPPHTCAQQFTYGNDQCWPALDSTAQVDTLWIGGFPIEVENISHVWDGDAVQWSGSGVVPLPFGTDKFVRVEWTNVQINTFRRICSGKVTGISDAPQYQPNFNPGPAPFGGEICVKPPSTPGFGPDGIHNVTGLPWDENGFGPTGTYDRQPPYPGYYPGAPYDTTKTYDSNGFNANGIHAQTGTSYNPSGCGANGLDSLNQPCNPNIPPYSWMNPGSTDQPTQEGLEFAEQVKDSLSIFITEILNDLEAEYEAKIDLKRDSCQEVRDEMESLLEDSHLDRAFVFGASDKYFEEGMHLNFVAKPELLKQVGVARSSTVKDLEGRHIDLYQCDKRLYVYVHFKEIILDFLGAGLNDLTADILADIERLPKSKIDQFISDPASFEQWLITRVKAAVNNEYAQQYGSIGYQPVPVPAPAAFLSRQHSELLAAGELGNHTAHLLLAQSLHARPQDIAFEYLQGFREIDGLHRAYFMEAMVNARHAASPFTEHDSLLMPIDITNRGADGKKYTVYLDNIEFFKDKALMDAYILIELPFGGHTLVFEAQDVLFTPYGPLAAPIKIQLGNDVHVRLNNSARLKLLAGPNTYVSFDCTGFAGIGIEADVELCRDVVLPYDPVSDSIMPEPKRVSGHFQTYMPSFSEFYVEFSMGPFAIPGYEDVKWMISKVALDMSESVSPSGAPPLGYLTPFAGPFGFTPLWKGFYIDSLLVRLPRQFSKDSTPIQVGIQDLVIDNQGVSGSVTVEDILPLSEGSAGGWAFSIDSFELTVLMNQFSRAQFSGQMHVPIFRGATNPDSTLSAQDCFRYRAEISPGNTYRFAIMPFTSQYAVDMWKAGTVTLQPNSSIEVGYHAGVFKTLATLNGTAKVNGNLFPGVGVDIPDIGFEGVKVSNQAPYFEAGTWEFPSTVGAKFAGFGITLSGISMTKTSDNDPALRFNAHIQITDDSTKIKASGGFLFIGRLKNDNGRQRWMFKDVEVDRLQVAGKLPGVYVIGDIHFYKNDPVYGTGFRGGVGATFDKFDASMQVLAQFGRMPTGQKYFFVDALFCGKIPLAGALDINGLGGGVYYRMNRPTAAFGLPACVGANAPIPPGIGTSLSGIVYTPDATKGVGFKITVAVALKSSERAFNANATYEMLFNSSGSIDRMWLYGNAQFMGDLNMSRLPIFKEDSVPPINAAISANLNLSFTFGPKSVLDGQLQVYANIGGVLRGVGEGGKVVDAKVRFSKDDWYIKVGAPELGQYAGMVFTLPVFGELARSESYFQIGSHVDDIPDLPAEIRNLVGGTSFNQSRSQQVNAGNGFCLGSHLILGPKDFKFLIFYAGLQMQLGFDISVINYGPGAVCQGSTSPIGINGWYAKGQIYAGIRGELGIRVKVFGAKRNFNILTLAAAAALEAQLPNPFWARASVGFSYNILGGLVRGSGNFDFEIGQQCKIVGEDPATDLPLIYSVLPPQHSKGLPVDFVPIVRFNFPVGQAFSYEALTGNSIQYKMLLDSARLMWRGYEISCTRKWDTELKLLRMEPNFFLPGNDSLTLRIKVHVDSSGITVDSEERIVGFRTGAGLRYIPADNVAGSYPFNKQYNFYKNELADGRGYVQLKRGQPDVFLEDEKYVKVVRFRKPGGECAWKPIHISSEDFWEKKIEFDLPLSFLQNEQIYEMQLLDYPRADPNWGNALTGAAPCLCTNCTTPLSLPPGGSTPLQNYPSEGDGPTPPTPAPTPPTEQVIYTAYFRVSHYNTFMDKLLDLQTQQTPTTGNKSGKGKTGGGAPDEATDAGWAFYVKTNIEPFDFYEVERGIMQISPSSVQPDPDNTLGEPWMKKLPLSWYMAQEYPSGQTHDSQKFGLAGIFNHKSEPSQPIENLKNENLFVRDRFGRIKVPSCVSPEEYPFPNLNIGPLLPSQNNYQLTGSGIRVSPGSGGTGQYLPSVTEQDYSNGQVANTPTVSQKLYFYAPLLYLYHAKAVDAALDAYIAKPTNDAAIRTAMGCSSTESTKNCICQNYYENTPPYSTAFKHLVATCEDDSVDQNDVTYPIRFTYQLPGTPQKTTDFIINLFK